MDINDLLDGIMKSINQFAEDHSRETCPPRHLCIAAHWNQTRSIRPARIFSFTA